MKIEAHWLSSAQRVPSPNADERTNKEISLIVVHNISLPAGHFGNSYVEQLFCNSLDTHCLPEFSSLTGLQVSSHLLIRRDGSTLQFVPFDQRAWHAGESNYLGRDTCNDFSIGIELEGSDYSEFQDIQYQRLAEIVRVLIDCYGVNEKNIVGHSDIAPGRKTDPGPFFHWDKFHKRLASV